MKKLILMSLLTLLPAAFANAEAVPGHRVSNHH